MPLARHVGAVAGLLEQHPAARSAHVSELYYFDNNDVLVWATYWSEKHQRKFYQFVRLDRELYDMPGGDAAEAAAETCATKLFTEAADYELKRGPPAVLMTDMELEHDFITGAGSGKVLGFV